MRHLKLSPAFILTSALFWYLIVILIYALLIIYWINKGFFADDKVVHSNELLTSIAAGQVARIVNRKRPKLRIKPFAKL